jgi:DNA-binding transcriptional ArsR family regulator
MDVSEVGSPDQCEVRSVDKEKVQLSRTRLLSDEVYAGLAETFGALADSNRAKIIYTLMEHELCVCDLASVVGISEPAVSQHLRILRTLRLVKQRKAGRMMYYSLNDEHVRTLVTICLEHAQHG